jgi:DNA polymerase III subunit gamma/tau
MSYDTKYRPVDFDDVLGQENTNTVLRQFIKSGTGFHQSYLFAGPYGSGKTTDARILARGLLCDNPVEGNPCNKCPSCVSILEHGSSENFVEFDAATNSGKADIKKIVEETEYSSFSGKRKLFLIDEAHQLSRDALDALLKPLEENIPGSQDKKMVCIFCTTEPEKMRTTIISRCAPAFMIKFVPPELIAGRLEYVCQQEGIEYDPEVLPLIAEITECHIRDALKAIEGTSMLGAVNKENVSAYLHLDINELLLDLLMNIEDPAQAMSIAESALERISPVQLYERLAEVSMLAFRVHIGATKKPDAFWNLEKIKALGELFGDRLVNFSVYLSSRPGKPTASILLCDLAHLGVSGGVLPMQVVVQPGKKSSQRNQKVGTVEEEPIVEAGVNQNGVYIDPKSVKRDVTQDKPLPVVKKTGLGVATFSQQLEAALDKRLGEEMPGGLSGRSKLGSGGVDPSGGDEDRGREFREDPPQ